MADPISTDAMISQMRQMIAQAQTNQNAETLNTVTGPTETNDFSSMLKNAVQTVSSNQVESQQLSESLMAGDPNVSALEVFVSMQKASVSFQAMVEVRNKIVSAYQEIMNMQV